MMRARWVSATTRAWARRRWRGAGMRGKPSMRSARARGGRKGGERTLERERADSEGESHGLFDCGCGCKRGRDGSRVIQMRRGKLRGKHANSGPHHRGDLRDAEGPSARGSRCMLGRRTPLFFSKLCLLTKYTHASVTVSEKSHPSASAPVPRRTPTPHLLLALTSQRSNRPRRPAA